MILKRLMFKFSRRLSNQPLPQLGRSLAISGLLLSLCLATPAQTLPPEQFDLSLSEAFQRAEEANPQLRAARRGLDVSVAEITIAGATPNPVFGVTYGLFDAYALFSNLQQVAATQVIELGGKRDARLTLAQSQLQLTGLELNGLRRAIRVQVRRSYAELVTAAAFADNLEQQINLLDRLVQVVRKRFQAGAVAEADLLQAQLSRTQTETLRIEAQNRIKRARVQLNTLLGNAPSRNTITRDQGIFNLSVTKTELIPRPDSPLPDLPELLSRASQERFDLRATTQQAEIARNELRLSESLRIPDIQLLGGFTFSAGSNGDPIVFGLLTGFNVTIPIFYNQDGEIARAKATLAQSTLQTTALQTQINADVQTAYQDLSAAQETIRRYQSRLLPESAEVLRLARRSYEVGKTGLSNVILAQQADQQIRSSYLDAIVTYQNAWADLEQAVGAAILF